MGGKDIGSTERRAVLFGNEGPAHEFGACEEFEERSFFRGQRVAGIGIDAVEEVGLLVVVGREDDVENYALEDLEVTVC